MKQPLFSTSYAPRNGESTLDEIEALRASKQFSAPRMGQAGVADRVAIALRKAFYDPSERNRFERNQDVVLSVSFSPDRKTIASASADNTIKLWDFNPSRLRALGCSQIRGYLETNPNVAETDRHLCDGVGDPW